MRLADEFTAGVVGTMFVPGYPLTMTRLEEQWSLAYIHDQLPLIGRLVRNPGNERDPNAIEVHVDPIGMVGHLPAGLAARLAPELDEGVPWEVRIARVRAHMEHPTQLGAQVIVRRLQTVAA